MADQTPKSRHKKLAKLPANARVHKRPLLRPAIPSPRAGADQPKIIYISTKTPFLAAVKRAEKLLHLSQKRLIQAATTVVQQNRSKRKRGADDLVEIAEAVEAQKKRQRVDNGGDGAGEEVIFKGTGKAIQKVLELALWFQQRDDYTVRLKTGTVGAVDDIELEENEAGIDDGKTEGERPVSGYDDDPGDAIMNDAPSASLGTVSSELKEIAPKDSGTIALPKKGKPSKGPDDAETEEAVPETRVRYTSVLEAMVGIR